MGSPFLDFHSMEAQALSPLPTWLLPWIRSTLLCGSRRLLYVVCLWSRFNNNLLGCLYSYCCYTFWLPTSQRQNRILRILRDNHSPRLYWEKRFPAGNGHRAWGFMYNNEQTFIITIMCLHTTVSSIYSFAGSWVS